MAQRKEKGADLRKSYPFHLEIGFILAMGALVLAFRSDWHPTNDFEIDARDQVLFTVEDIKPTDPEAEPPAPPRPAVPVAVPDDELLEEDPIMLDFLNEEPVLTSGPPDPVEEDTPEAEPEIFVVVEEQPKPIGGMASIYKHITYPDMARRAGVEGMVVLEFVVDERGDVSDARIIKGVGAGLDEAALEAVNKVKFTPGRQRGKAVKVRMTLPITFKLK